jgi:hypothetical protein|tara:strand:- start:160 stop:384 length:225 start_codon:yes stop_codon:yes gene_type:complete
MTLSKGERTLSNAINQEMDRDPLFLEKCEYHEKIMSKLLGDKIPMILAETKEGQKQLDVINAKVSKAMIEKYGG